MVKLDEKPLSDSCVLSQIYLNKFKTYAVYTMTMLVGSLCDVLHRMIKGNRSQRSLLPMKMEFFLKTERIYIIVSAGWCQICRLLLRKCHRRSFIYSLSLVNWVGMRARNESFSFQYGKHWLKNEQCSCRGQNAFRNSWQQATILCVSSMWFQR